jgi:hypothetical protein
MKALFGAPRRQSPRRSTSACLSIVFLVGLALGPAVDFAQSASAPGDLLLGRAHTWVRIGRTDLSHAAAREWGVDRERHLGIAVYGRRKRAGRRIGPTFYIGGELSHSATDRAVNAEGDVFNDFDFLSLELNDKIVFELKNGLALGVGTGFAIFYVDGEEESTLPLMPGATSLADAGFGYQAFVDFDWRVRRLILGLDVKYQRAFDIININYSNYRLGAHVGLTF